MGGGVLGMLKRHEVQVLLKAGHSQVEAARLAGVSLSSVKRIADEAAVSEVEDAAERAKRGIGRPSRVGRFRDFVEGVLRESPQLPSHEVLRRAKLEGYTGGKSALYGLIASVRPKSVDLLVRFEGLPGEFSQHDFGQVDVEYLDGTMRRISNFAEHLPSWGRDGVVTQWNPTLPLPRSSLASVWTCAGRTGLKRKDPS